MCNKEKEEKSDILENGEWFEKVDKVIEIVKDWVKGDDSVGPDDPILEGSILDEIKKLIGLDSEYVAFDVDIIIAINSSFFTLYQLGVGSNKPFSISDNLKKWGSFSRNVSIISAVKQYIFLKVRQAFDPPTSSYVLNQSSSLINELEWRLREMADGMFLIENETEPTEPDNPVENPLPEYDVATNEEVDDILDETFGDNYPLDSEVATNEEVDELLETVFNEDEAIATDEEVSIMLNNIFGG